MVDYIIIFSEEQMLKSSPAKSILVRLYLESVHTFTRLTVSAALETFPKCVKLNYTSSMGKSCFFFGSSLL